MYKSGHMGINMILFAPILFIMMSFEYIFISIFGLIIITYFASLPDIDLKYQFLTHRGFTHTYLFGLFIGLISSSLFTIINVLSINSGIIEPSIFNMIGIPIWGFFIGLFTVMGHIIGDVITPAGIRPFKKPKYIPNLPIFSDKKYTFDLVYAANTWANIGFLLIGIMSTTISIISSFYIINI